MRDLKTSLIQTSLSWENPSDNRAKLEKKMLELEQTDLIILPEMFTTGFSMSPGTLAEGVSGETVQWLQSLSAQMQSAITGSIIIKEHDQFANRLFFVKPDGSFEYYDKRHLFRMAGEHEHYTQGQKKTIVEWKGWRICPLICYDLRFPVWSRNQDDYDVLIFVANWPSRRDFAWRSLLVARAIENLSYTIGVNVIGRDGNDVDYCGSSLVADMSGTIIEDMQDLDESRTVSLSINELQEYRKRFPFAVDADRFVLE